MRIVRVEKVYFFGFNIILKRNIKLNKFLFDKNYEKVENHEINALQS